MKKTFATLFMMAAACLFAAGTANADSLVINPSDFVVGQPGTSNVIHTYMGTSLYVYADSTYRYHYAPVHLPHGAQVTSVIVLYDDDSTYNVTVGLYRANIYNRTQQAMCSWTSSADTSAHLTYKIQPITYGYINNTGYGYYVYVYFNGGAGSSLEIEGIRINYNAP
jgi:hypothetical protein